MEKKISDYLHLYLGCRVQNKPYTGLPPSEKDHFTVIGDLEYIIPDPTGLIICCIRNYDSAGFKWDELSRQPIGDVKPILRPLSDMTEEEGKEFEATKVFIRATPVHQVGNMQWTPETFRWALSKHFDLFQLIESGLAIDKSKTI